MEPMALGSPGSPGSQSPTSPFLPGFLMGDPMLQPTSPSKTPRQIHFAPNLSTTIATPGSPCPPGTSSLSDNLSRFHKNQREKSGGPPTAGLFDTLEASAAGLSIPSTSNCFQQQVGHLPQVHLSGNVTPNQNVPCADENEKWVTVFGFPPAATSSILGQFSQVGHILEHRFPGQGNWVNICYSTKLDARRALSYNGKIVGGHTMIGVIPYRDYSCSRRLNPYINTHPFTQSTIRGCPCENYVQQGSALRDMTNVLSCPTTPVTPKSPQVSRLGPRNLLATPCSSPYAGTPRGGRPLGFSSPTDNEVIGSQNTPTKNTSIVTKAVDFVFGW